MKSVHYFNKIKNINDGSVFVKEMWKVFFKMCEETQGIIVERGTMHRPVDIQVVVREQNEKFNAFLRRCNDKLRQMGVNQPPIQYDKLEDLLGYILVVSDFDRLEEELLNMGSEK